MAEAAAAVQLRTVWASDLPVFFEQQLDPQANYMAAFTVPDPANRAGFEARWEHFFTDATITSRTIIVDGRVAGNVMSFMMSGRPSVAYWLGREFWGKGIATQALGQFLEIVHVRPIYAQAAKDNLASIRVLEKCGFRVTGEERGYANARGMTIDEVLLELSGDGAVADSRPGESTRI